MSDAQRAQAAFTLTDQVRALVWAAVRRAHPAAPPHELRCRYAEQVYGPELARRVQKWRR